MQLKINKERAYKLWKNNQLPFTPWHVKRVFPMATVSRVVNGNPNVKPETRKKVLDVIKQLNYRPNAVARGLASKKIDDGWCCDPRCYECIFCRIGIGD